MRTAVIGTGSWGTALAVHLGTAGREVALWGRDPALVEDIRARAENAPYLPGVPIPPSVFATAALDEALADADIVTLAVPSHGLRPLLRAVGTWLRPGALVISATKGLELVTLHRMSEVIQQELGLRRRVAVLSGPSFAAEVARRLPTAVVMASEHADAAALAQECYTAPSFRVYTSDDVTGVEMGGAMKNVIAIAAGVVESLQLGHNASAALITRGLAEMSRLALAVGGRRETMAGLSGLGDLVLTCTGTLSRNRRVGVELGRGRALGEILADARGVAEGVHTTAAALTLGERHGVELPITAQMLAVLEGRKDPRSAVEDLMLRPARAEHEAKAGARS